MGVLGGQGFLGCVELPFALGGEPFGGFRFGERAVALGGVGEDRGYAAVAWAGAPVLVCGVDRGVLRRFGGAGA